MRHIRDQVIRWVAILAVLFGTCMSCALAIYYFYNLHGATHYPFKSQAEQGVTVIRTALIATFLSSWAIWFGVRHCRSLRRLALWAAIGTLITLVLYGIAGCGGVLGGDWKNASWNGVSDVIFPSAFFAEYNFLTFIFEIAPTTAVAEFILLYFLARKIIPAGAEPGISGLPISG